MTRTRTAFLGLLAAGVVARGAVVVATSAAPTAETQTLHGGAGSIDDLVAAFRRALETKDKALLRSLRVDEREYIDLILPGSVDEGAPWATYDQQANRYFWSVLNTKSIYSEAGLLSAYGGKPLKLTHVEYRKGVKKYRDYTAYKQLTLTFDDGTPDPEHVKIGSIAEVDGQYKFISFVRD
jgi:hypothetical protein